MVAIATIPLQQAFTVGIGAAAVPVSGILFLVAGAANAAVLFRSTTALGRIARALFCFNATALFVVFIPLDRPYWPPGHYRSSPEIDALITASLTGASIIIFLAIASSDAPTWSNAVKAYRYGLIIAGALWLYGVVSFVAGLPTMPGSVPLPQSFGGIVVPRNGSFGEGNYLGAYAFFGVLIGLRARQRDLLLMGVALILLSQATAALLAIGILAIGWAIRRPLATAVGAIAAIALSTTVYLSQLASLPGIAKLLDFGTAAQNPASSQAERLSLLRAAACMFRTSPVFGVGPGRYDQWFHACASAPTSFHLLHLPRTIANNFFAQGAAELGAPAGVCLVLITVYSLHRGWRGRVWQTRIPQVMFIGAGVLPLLAFPSVSSPDLWVMLALLAWENRREGGSSSLKLRPSRRHLLESGRASRGSPADHLTHPAPTISGT